MAFGQQQGFPATARQMQQLMSMVTDAGHVDLRDARGPLGLTQRQAGGKFTRDEADEMIARLEAEAESASTDDAHPSKGPTSASKPVDRREAQQVASLRKISAEVLAAELQRRGWIVVEP